MLFDLAIIIFAVSIVLSPISSLTALKIKNYLTDNYSQTELFNYVDNTFYFRIRKLKRIYEQSDINDEVIEKFIYKYSLISKIGLTLFLISILMMIIYFVQSAKNNI